MLINIYFKKILIFSFFILLATSIFLVIPRKDSHSKKVSNNIETAVSINNKQQIQSINKADIKGDEIAYCWENIRQGDLYVKNGDFRKAVEVYEKAYSITAGSPAVSGLHLARAYEKLLEYDSGIELVNDMIKNHYLSEKGVEMANEIKSRLLAAKSQSSQTQPTQSE